MCITKTNLIQNKKYQSCRICYVGGKKNISFSDSYIVLKVPGDHRQELTERLPLEHGIPTRPCALTLESQRGGLKCLDLGAGGSENGSFFKDADFGETALHKSLFVSVP